MAETKPKKEKIKFSVPLMVAGMPTVPNGEIYSMMTLQRIMERITLKPRLIVQEMNPVERNIKKIPLAEPWSKKIMADIVQGHIVGNSLVIDCECRNNRDGRKLAGMLETIGMAQIDFFPVGYGLAGTDGMVSPDYTLNYVAVEPKNMVHQ